MAMELALTGRLVEAQEAELSGLVNRLTEQGGALAGAFDIAIDCSECSPCRRSVKTGYRGVGQ